MCLFNILTQEGWVEVMHDTMAAVNEHLAPLVALLFIIEHNYMTWVSVSYGSLLLCAILFQDISGSLGWRFTHKMGS